MPQIFLATRCFSCKTFQVQQTKKSNKWVCKLCGEKQSLKKVYCQGRAVDCRKHVQALNMAQAECNIDRSTSYDDGALHINDDDGAQRINDPGLEDRDQKVMSDHDSMPRLESKWSAFISCHQEAASDCNNEDEQLEENLFTTDRKLFDQQKRRKKRFPFDKKDSALTEKVSRINDNRHSEPAFTKSNQKLDVHHSEFSLVTTSSDMDQGNFLVRAQDIAETNDCGFETGPLPDNHNKLTHLAHKQVPTTNSRWGKYV